MKQILTIEQSKRLIGLGVDAKLAGDSILADEYNEQSESFRHPVFMLADLLCILPKKVSDRQRIYELEISVDHYSDAWCVQYTHNSDVNNLEDSFQSAEELCDAIYAEICWLKENPELVWL